ncbi:MAG: PhnD/SsuA/transferrin family substrate-binding protein [Myxococcota bacterium]
MNLPHRFAIATSRDPGFVMPRLRTACDALGELFATRVSGHLMVAYDDFVFGAEREDFAWMWLPPRIASQLLRDELAVPVAVPVRQGQTAFSMAIFTRYDHPDIHTLADVRDRSAAWVDRRSSSGYVVPRARLAAAGIDPDEALGDVSMLRSHQAVVAAVLGGADDFGATYVRLDGDEVVDAGWKDRPVRVLDTCGPIPGDVLVAGRGTGAEQTAAARAALLAEGPVCSALAELIECDGFAAVTDAHLEALLDLAPR